MSGTKIKICGLFRPCDAEYVNSAFPDYAGFVFYEKSHRNVTPSQAKELRLAIDKRIKTVGVFVNAPKELITTLCRENIIDIVQLHGGEGVEYIEALRILIPGVPIWEAYKIRSSFDMVAAEKSKADMPLLDNGYGTGEAFDWSLIRDFPRPFILAGGLTPENIPTALSRFHPDIIDISSGVESAGIKDKDKIFAAVVAVKRS